MGIVSATQDTAETGHALVHVADFTAAGLEEGCSSISRLGPQVAIALIANLNWLEIVLCAWQRHEASEGPPTDI